MSAAGISMLYVASNQDTALYETADRPGKFAIAEFSTTRNLIVLDLASFQSIEDHRFRSLRGVIVEDISKPIERDDRVHTEYVPTQIFTEQFSYNWYDDQNRPIEGLRYPSSITGDASYVLFFNQPEFLLDGSPFILENYKELDLSPNQLEF